MMKFSTTLMATAAILMTPVLAEDTKDGWTGEGSLSAGVTSGNTETSDLGLGLKLSKKTGLWTIGGLVSADYGEIDEVEAKNRVYLEGNLERKLSDALFAFGQLSYEKDEFTGYESRSFIGGGLGWQVFDTEQTKWSLRGGPGLKIDELRETVDEFDVVVTEGETVNSFSIVAASDYAYKFNDNVALSNVTDVLYAEDSTQIGNALALTAKLSEALSARFSYDIRHDTNPPAGFEDTDTATRISLVYGF